jgi:hypothetical protein
MSQVAKSASAFVRAFFRFTPESGLRADIAPFRLCANVGSSDTHSMTSSARIMIVAP